MADQDSSPDSATAVAHLKAASANQQCPQGTQQALSPPFFAVDADQATTLNPGIGLTASWQECNLESWHFTPPFAGVDG
jgi:hypothetical protein